MSASSYPLRITAPAAHEDLDRHREAVDARRLLQGIRRQAFHLQALFGELPPQGRLQADVLHRTAAAEESERARGPDAFTLVPQVKQVSAVAVVDQRGGVDGLWPPVEALVSGVQELGTQGRGPDVGELEPPGAGNLIVLHCELGVLLGHEVEDEAEVEVLVGPFALGGVRVDVVDVDVDRSREELRSQAQVARPDAGLLARLPQRPGQERPVVSSTWPPGEAGGFADF
ncbi:hypothetical protein M2271_002464 [Streptomyces sp. LBL]|nr:hypothetical protein [Streptomyces sp. LBL]